MSFSPAVIVVDAASAVLPVNEVPVDACVTAMVWLPIDRLDEANVPIPKAPPPTATRSGPLVTWAFCDETLPEEILRVGLSKGADAEGDRAADRA